MSQYNKTILTNAGLELAKRANAGQAKFEITRAVTSADDWSSKTIQDLEEVTAIPNIMQQGTVMDTEEVESNNSVIGVSLCFANKNLSTGYQIRIIGVYVKEEGQENDFLYAVTTAVSPEYMPDFSDGVLYRFNMQLYLVIGKAQAVNVVINDGASVTHGQFDKYKDEVTANLEKIENAHKEDMSHVVKSASINGGDEILPDEAGKLELVVPDPDLSKYVSLEQLTETLKTKADVTAIPDKTATEEGIRQAKELAQEADTKAQSALDTKADKTTVEENLATKANQSDLDQTNAEVAKKADSEDVTSQINSKTSGTVVTAYDIASKNPTTVTNSYTSEELVDQGVLGQFADQINQLKGRQKVDAPDFNTLTDTGIYYITNPQNGKNFPTTAYGVLTVFNGSNNGGTRITQIYAPDNGQSLFVRTPYNSAGTVFTDWNQIAWKSDITNLQNQVDSKTTGTVVTAYDIASKNPTTVTNSYTSEELVDQGVLGQFADQINQLKGRQKVDAPDFNTLTDTGVYYISNPDKGKNFPDHYQGVLAVFNGNSQRITQIYAGDDGVSVFMRTYGVINGINSWGSWNHIAWTSDITNLQNAVNSKVNVDGSLYKDLKQFNNWSDLFDDYAHSKLTATIGRLVAFRDDTNGSNTVGSFGSGIAFGGGDTSGVLSVDPFNSRAIITAGNAGKPHWHEDIAWKSDITNLQNQIQQLKDNQFEVQTFTDATAAASWEAQRPGKRMAIVNS